MPNLTDLIKPEHLKWLGDVEWRDKELAGCLRRALGGDWRVVLWHAESGNMRARLSRSTSAAAVG